MWNKSLRISVASDIHLGHRKNPAKSIIKNLDAHLSNDKHLASIDMLVLAGDVFDELLPLNSEDVPHIKAWIARLLRLCRKHKVILRVLEGTPLHDREQSFLFVAINEIHERNSASHIDLRWVTDLEIEYFSEFDVHCLFVPDEWTHSTQETLRQVKALMAEKDLAQVDFAFMHGQFRHQIPEMVKENVCHDAQEYLALVKSLIWIGHVHIHSVFERIIAQGSYDRLTHGQPEPKGFVTAIIEPDGTYEATFIENIGAMRFDTVQCPYDDVEESIRALDRVCEKLPDGSHVRIHTTHGNAILSNLDALRARWPTLLWTTPKVDDKDDDNVDFITEESVYVPIIIDRHNLKDLVMARLQKLSLNPSILARCDTNLGLMQRL